MELKIPMSQPEGTRFDSWKEIASYLRHDIRTVRRWEKERGLPVHRIPGRTKSAVYAVRSEIDAWLSGRLAEPKATDAVSLHRPSTNEFDHPPLGNEDDCPSNPPAPLTGLLKSQVGLKTYGHTTFKTSRFRLGSAMVAMLVGAGVLAGLFAWIYRSSATSVIGSEAPPHITSVTSIMPKRNQSIVIRGSGFGMFTAYENMDSPFIAVRDKTAGWSGGRIIPQNCDAVTLSVGSWQDKQIVISGFAGAYGSEDLIISPGDVIEIAIWNPQSGHGPALYHLFASASPTDGQKSGTIEEQNRPNTVKNRIPRHR